MTGRTPVAAGHARAAGAPLSGRHATTRTPAQHRRRNFGKVFDRTFADKADHIETTAGTGRQHFGPDKSFRSSLDRSARRAAWRMIRREENVDE
ncbi:hypothetical protein ACIRJR_21345 [Streptomyces sp. NPDC102402]|uniref:hypothetical protein n=1 Tax=Streptomyces sp. NPDC102402 TaxID=3366169 RepID=UPI003823884F